MCAVTLKWPLLWCVFVYSFLVLLVESFFASGEEGFLNMWLIIHNKDKFIYNQHQHSVSYEVLRLNLMISTLRILYGAKSISHFNYIFLAPSLLGIPFKCACNFNQLILLRSSVSNCIEQIKVLLADTQRANLTKKLSEANQQNRFLKRQVCMCVCTWDLLHYN